MAFSVRADLKTGMMQSEQFFFTQVTKRFTAELYIPIINAADKSGRNINHAYEAKIPHHGKGAAVHRGIAVIKGDNNGFPNPFCLLIVQQLMKRYRLKSHIFQELHILSKALRMASGNTDIHLRFNLMIIDYGNLFGIHGLQV